MSVIYKHPVIAATRALRFADHVTKGNGGSEDENAVPLCNPRFRHARYGSQTIDKFLYWGDHRYQSGIYKVVQFSGIVYPQLLGKQLL